MIVEERENRYECGICGHRFDGPVPGIFDLYYDARQVGGDVVIDGDNTVEWEIEETAPDLCFECTDIVAKVLMARKRGDVISVGRS